MKVDYRDRNYIVFKGKSIDNDDIINAMGKYCDDEKTFSLLRVNDVRMVRNIWYDSNNRLMDFKDYIIHNYHNYSYILDFDITSLMWQYSGHELDADSLGIYGGYDGLIDLISFAELDEDNYYEILPKLLYNSNNNDLSYLIMKYFAPENLSYVIYNSENDKINAISIQNQDLMFRNYDGIYYSLLNGNEQILSNNPELLSEFTNDINKIPENSIYEDGMIRTLKWK